MLYLSCVSGLPCTPDSVSVMWTGAASLCNKRKSEIFQMLVINIQQKSRFSYDYDYPAANLIALGLRGIFNPKF